MANIIKITACVQCGCLLNPKCKACSKNKNRLPQALYIYDIPTSKATGPCGCLLIKCEGPKCDKWMWKRPIEAKKYKHCFCSLFCSARLNAQAKMKQVPVICGNPKCDRENGKRKNFLCPPNRMRRSKQIFCCPACWYIFMKLEKVEETAELLHCAKCRDVTEHERTRKGSICSVCETVRSGSVRVSV